MALDMPDTHQARTLVEKLDDQVHFYKVGMELFMNADCFSFIDWLKQQGKKVFVDLKFFDIPATVGRAVAALSEKGVDFATVHGNDAILKAAVDNKGSLKVLAVTCLTSLDRGDLNDLGFACDIENLVYSRARRALALGCDGVVSSGLEAQRLRRDLDNRLLIITPGVRPVDNREADDQKRVVSVTNALAWGADYIVVGRPIRDASDPKAAAAAIQAQITDALTAPVQ